MDCDLPGEGYRVPDGDYSVVRRARISMPIPWLVYLVLGEGQRADLDGAMPLRVDRDLAERLCRGVTAIGDGEWLVATSNAAVAVSWVVRQGRGAGPIVAVNLREFAAAGGRCWRVGAEPETRSQQGVQSGSRTEWDMCASSIVLLKGGVGASAVAGRQKVGDYVRLGLEQGKIQDTRLHMCEKDRLTACCSS